MLSEAQAGLAMSLLRAFSETEPTHFTLAEGDRWIPWETIRLANEYGGRIFAVRFSDNRIFDIKAGWRFYEPESKERS